MGWSTSDIPRQDGRVAIVTGANSGLGRYTTLELARSGARVVMACRNHDKAQAARADMLAEVPGAALEIQPLDLSDLDSVESFAETFCKDFSRLDLLVNNAGVMIPPYTRTPQGFELQVGTNHLGHFALTAQLLERLLSTDGSRVVSVASLAHHFGTIRLDDLNWERGYNPWLAYGQSKLANLLFSLELDRRLRAGGHSTRSLAAHPGFAATNLQAHSGFIDWLTPKVAQSAAEGALGTLRAATDPEAQGGEYYGPKGMFGTRGAPQAVTYSRKAKDPGLSRKLWELSQELVGVPFLPAR